MQDVKRLISEVAAQNGIRVEPDDPLFALVRSTESCWRKLPKSYRTRFRHESQDSMRLTKERKGARAPWLRKW